MPTSDRVAHEQTVEPVGGRVACAILCAHVDREGVAIERAARRPVNVRPASEQHRERPLVEGHRGIGAAVVAPWPTIVVAVVLYLVLAAITFFDEAEAARAAG